jgi:hypothetical protein
MLVNNAWKSLLDAEPWNLSPPAYQDLAVEHLGLDSYLPFEGVARAA